MSVTLETDLAELRRLAETGRDGPLLGGRFLALYGVLTACALAAIYVMLSSGVGGWWITAVYLGAIGLGVAGGAAIRRNLAQQPGAGTLANTVQATVWTMGALALLTFFAGVVARQLLGLPSSALSGALIGVVAFLVYGIAFLTSAKVSRAKWMRIPGFASFGAAILLFVTGDQLWSLLLSAGCVVLLAVVPGLILMRQEKAGA